MGKVIHWELCKKWKFDHTNNWYMHNPESVLENDTHKLLWDFVIQISARRPDLIIISKKERTRRIVDFAFLADHRVELEECEKKNKSLDLTRELKKKTVKHESDDYSNCNCCSGYSDQRIDTGTGGLGNIGKVGDCPNNCIVEID